MSTTARTKRPTIRDVAAKAGVSKSLVSLVFSAPQTVSSYRKGLVLKAADELGFSPSFLARSLATETGTFIGILVADLHNPLFAQIVDQVRVALEAEGEYSFMTSAMLLNSQGEQILDSKTVSALIDLRPKSVLVVGSIPDLHRLASLPESVDIVIASAISKDVARATTVRSNDEIGMRLLIEHLVENGHKKISHISVDAGEVSKSRRGAYESVMKEKGLARFISVELAKSATEIDGFEAAARLMNSQTPPTAITAFNDLLAIGAQGATNGTVAITGYDNTFLADLRQISLTSVDPGNTEIADKAAQLLLKNDKTERTKTYLMEPKLIVRNSSKSLVRNN
ncbi:MAG: LacI family DNA-binding transcriptional regulator [Actinobacteria bacterium]|nr:LacI family DNA-binding transcriptional regulator [Actinomycetota bacterium]MDA2981815.1 LacI family DNA-binding transcriptional regulator [Actinomycetota bacterium]MDA2996668.1 LacI family DNA-binding transcriptional regulator [Actinomycetota bacterium]